MEREEGKMTITLGLYSYDVLENYVGFRDMWRKRKES